MSRKTALTAAASFAAGLLTGLVYWLVNVESPAPPPISLLGLLGMVTGQWAAIRLLRRIRTARSRRCPGPSAGRRFVIRTKDSVGPKDEGLKAEVS